MKNIWILIFLALTPTILAASTSTTYVDFYIEPQNSTNNQTNNTTNQTFDTTPPIISNISPADGFTKTSPTITFSFSITDASPVTCKLIIDNQIAHSSTNITNNTITTTKSVNKGTHTWNIECTDTNNNTQTTQQRTFRITTKTDSNSNDDSTQHYYTYQQNKYTNTPQNSTAQVIYLQTTQNYTQPTKNTILFIINIIIAFLILIIVLLIIALFWPDKKNTTKTNQEPLY